MLLHEAPKKGNVVIARIQGGNIVQVATAGLALAALITAFVKVREYMDKTDQLEAKVSQARASLALAQAQVKQAEATVRETTNKMERSRELARTGMCSEEECDAARAAWERAVADLERYKAQVVLS